MKDNLILPFVEQQFVEPTKIDKWAVANFSARCNVRQLVDDLMRIGGMKGVVSWKTSILFFFFVLENLCVIDHQCLLYNCFCFVICDRKSLLLLMCLRRVISFAVLLLSFVWRRCLKRSSLSSLVLHSSFFASSPRGRIVTFMVRYLSS